MESRADKAVELFKSGCNCSQAVVATYSDFFGIDEETALKMSCGFGGGMGRMREVCGAFSGTVLLAGLKEGSPEQGDRQATAHVYETVRALADEFKKENPSIVCKELLGLSKPPESAVPDERTQEYYKKRPCAEIVRSAAKAVETLLFPGEFED